MVGLKSVRDSQSTGNLTPSVVCCDGDTVGSDAVSLSTYLEYLRSICAATTFADKCLRDAVALNSYRLSLFLAEVDTAPRDLRTSSVSQIRAILSYGEVEHAQTVAGCCSLYIAKILADDPLDLSSFGDVVVLTLTLDLQIQDTVLHTLVGILHGNLVADRSTLLEYHVLLVGRQLGYDVNPTVLLGVDLDDSTTNSGL